VSGNPTLFMGGMEANIRLIYFSIHTSTYVEAIKSVKKPENVG